MIRVLSFAIFCSLTCAGWTQQYKANPSLIQNTDFQWEDGVLKDWTVERGAGSGKIKSIIRKTSDGALQFVGRQNVQVWDVVSQNFETSAGDFLRFSYTAKATGVQQQRGQFRNCYAGIWFSNSDGQNLGNTFFPITDEEFTSHERVVQVPATATIASVTMFLSMTGDLQFKTIDVQKLETDDSFDVLVSQLNRYYSYFEYKQIDWPGLAEKYRTEATEASDRREFENVVSKMLGEFRDGHVWIVKNGTRVPTWRPERPALNFDFGIVGKQLKDVKRFGPIGLVAATNNDLTYVRVTGLQGDPKNVEAMMAEITERFGSRGMVIDLRANGGGSEPFARAIAGLFCKEPVQYAINRFRKNDKLDEFFEYPRSPVMPAEDKEVFDGPVVCLIGPGAVSSAEGMAMMFQALPNATLMGQPTRGSSGNPASVVLPNQVEVWFSRWVACTADGQPIEDRGVQPDVIVKHQAGSDATWIQAKESFK